MKIPFPLNDLPPMMGIAMTASAQVLGALLFGARHSARWPDAFRQDHRSLG